jgi:Flp pilus assembly pilin Flp
MVEYALLLTMVAVPMIVIYATLGNAVGQVWQSIIDNLEENSMFTIKEYTLNATSTLAVSEEIPTETATITITVDPYGPPTDTPTVTLVPTDTEVPTATEIPPTATHFIPATMTFTASPVPPTETPTDVPTATATATPVYVSVTKVDSYWDGDKVTISLEVDSNRERVYVLNLNSGTTKTVTCRTTCTVSFYDSTHSAGFVLITTNDGDNIVYFYPSDL